MRACGPHPTFSGACIGRDSQNTFPFCRNSMSGIGVRRPIGFRKYAGAVPANRKEWTQEEGVHTVKQFILRCTVLSLVVLVGATMSLGAIITVGDPIEIGSWTQRFQESGVGTFDYMGVKMISGDDAFLAPVFRNFS